MTSVNISEVDINSSKWNFPLNYLKVIDFNKLISVFIEHMGLFNIIELIKKISHGNIFCDGNAKFVILEIYINQIAYRD